MQYGFILDQERCIGCHACTVACKAENDVPVGDFRTWVKYTEQGSFPEIKRDFTVLRCNHCTDAPCVTICPVNALEKRKDGIVDIDRDACIGCRACMQACPYDAIYLNQDSGAVEKCHFCAHRVENGLEPACVTVCPVNAIIPGDLHDPESRASTIIRERETQVRRPEQKTGPNVHYLGADELGLHPGRAERPPMYMFSDRPADKEEPWPISLPVLPQARVVLDTGHKIEWGWPVSLYLVTKGVGAGAAILAPFAVGLGLTGWMARFGPEIIALLFTLITCALLVEDLARPARFYRLLTRPNFSSWLVKGGIVLSVFQALLVGGLVARIAGAETLADILRYPTALAGLGAAGYTAFLFAQCKGRDLWESSMLLPHLLVQATMCGAAALIPFCAVPRARITAILILATITHGFFVWIERARKHTTENARQAAAFLDVVKVGPLQANRDGVVLCFLGALLVGTLLPVAAPLPILLGLWLSEHAFIRAGQLPPLS